MKKLMFVVMVALSFSAVAEYAPEQWNLDARKQFAAQRFGIFIHWGLYANYAQGEWYQQRADGTETAKTRKGDVLYTITIRKDAFPTVAKGPAR